MTLGQKNLLGAGEMSDWIESEILFPSRGYWPQRQLFQILVPCEHFPGSFISWGHYFIPILAKSIRGINSEQSGIILGDQL